MAVLTGGSVMRFKAVVAAMLALFWLSMWTSPVAAGTSGPKGVPAGASQAQSACGLVEQDQYWFCKALEDRTCGLVSGSDEYWFCKGLVEKQCGLIQGAGYRFCHAVTARNCDEIGGDGYWLCRGLLEQNCALAPRQHYWMCSALKASFRPEE
jgi:hypothetical protein